MIRSFFKCEPKCPKRKPGCQDHCDIYLTAKTKHDARKKEYYGDRDITQYIAEKHCKAKDLNAKQRKDSKSNKWSRN